MKANDIFTSEDLRMLTDIGFMAASRQLLKPAIHIFNIIERLRPEQEAGFLGAALVALIQRNFSEAEKKLKQAPQTPAVKIFTALNQIHKGNTQTAYKILEDVSKASVDETLKKFAKELLEANRETFAKQKTR